MDYCDVLSYALHGEAGTVLRVQHPKKWQPGEVDGLYFSSEEGGSLLYPVEAKALSTKDDVNLGQVQGAYNTIIRKHIGGVKIVPLAVQMTAFGMFIAVFEPDQNNQLVMPRALKVKLEPPIEAWQKSRKSRQ